MVQTRSMTCQGKADHDKKSKQRDEEITAEYFQTLLVEKKIKEFPEKYVPVI